MVHVCTRVCVDVFAGVRVSVWEKHANRRNALPPRSGITHPHHALSDTGTEKRARAQRNARTHTHTHTHTRTHTHTHTHTQTHSHTTLTHTTHTYSLTYLLILRPRHRLLTPGRVRAPQLHRGNGSSDG